MKEKWYGYDISHDVHVYEHTLVHIHCTFFIVPPPSVNVTNSSATYAGTNFNLTCTIELNTAVDTPVVVNSTWHGPLGIPTGTRVIASEPIGTGARYQTTLMFRPLNTSDSGHYTCEATVSPSPESQFIITSRTGRVTLRIDVQGKRTHVIFVFVNLLLSPSPHQLSLILR